MTKAEATTIARRINEQETRIAGVQSAAVEEDIMAPATEYLVRFAHTDRAITTVVCTVEQYIAYANI